ncbi:MAG: hypothetical protein DRJ31_06525 [Candidatus Methanomethylicota archaeon]|uniref:Uncharacterized protein n=1 Tax=Thermoproteota archaeon TaxID=2056631 RepID=A0A497EVW7_9CREN|nr:MAG: hypothetical protein DRJ31_06525 [Candidatus Verstraetearchaeota archaeon]RLE51249.1 MAG: hypothetical protein DRJ33_06285 [Candidatus Verstraetearchaeota archaeon]
MAVFEKVAGSKLRLQTSSAIKRGRKQPRGAKAKINKMPQMTLKRVAYARKLNEDTFLLAISR